MEMLNAIFAAYQCIIQKKALLVCLNFLRYNMRLSDKISDKIIDENKVNYAWELSDKEYDKWLQAVKEENAREELRQLKERAKGLIWGIKTNWGLNKGE